MELTGSQIGDNSGIFKISQRLLRRVLILIIAAMAYFGAGNTELIAQNKDTTAIGSDSRLFFKVNSRRSLVSDGKISIRGFRLGTEFNEKHRLGVGVFDSGLYGLNGGAIVPFFDIELSPSPLQVQVDLGYFTVFYEYVLYRNKKWHVTFDHQWGIGKAKKRFRDNNGILLQTKNITKPLVEATFELQYKIRPWLNASAGLGYRFILDREDEVVTEAFDSPIYVLKVRMSISYFVRKISSGKKKDK